MKIFLFVSVLLGFSFQLQSQYYFFAPPKGEINIFNSPDHSKAALEYNLLKYKSQRDSLIRVRILEDWTDSIKGVVSNEVFWVCGNFAMQLWVNSHDIGDGVVLEDDNLIYKGYRGFNQDSIYLNSGTLKDMGKLGLPVMQISVTDPITIPDGHGLCAVLTGDDYTNWYDWNIIETQFDISNATPGVNTYIPKDCGYVAFSYFYLSENFHGQKVLNDVIMLVFKLQNGIPEIIYNVNSGMTPPNYNINPHFNEIFHVIEHRDIIPPELEVYAPTNNSCYTENFPILEYHITDENFNFAWFSLDGGKTKLPLDYEGNFEIPLANGNYEMIIYTEDHFRLSASDTIKFEVNTDLTYTESFLAFPIISYPNPASNRLFIRYPTDIPVIIKSYFISGSLINLIEDSDLNGETQLDISTYVPGEYFYTISDGKNFKYTAKYIKK